MSGGASGESQRNGRLGRVPVDNLTLSVMGLEEISSVLLESVTHAVSLVDPGQPLPETLDVVAAEQRMVVYAHDALDGAEDRKVPSYEDAVALCHFADALNVRPHAHLLVHCHMGRSRSPAAAAIMLLRLGGLSPREALRRVRAVRDPIWPNATLLAHGDRLLGLGGTLIAACEEVYRDVMEKHPLWVADPHPRNLPLSMDLELRAKAEG